MENKVIQKLKEYGIEIYNVHANSKDDEIVITAENMTIICKDNNVYVNFHIIAKPSFSARIVLILKEIKKMKVLIGEDFVFDENGKFMDGEEAEMYHKEFQKKITISQFLEQQQQLYFLSKAKSYLC